MLLNSPENYDNHILNNLKEINNIHSEMGEVDRKFLNGIVRQIKPKKILEVGVASGGSAAIILNAINEYNDSFLYSVDYFKEYYRDKTKDSGFIIKELYPHFLNKWKLYTGGTIAKFIDNIGKDIDLCLLDTVHSNPGEFLDFLVVLPYLKNGSVLVIHDIALHVLHYPQFYGAYTCGILFSCIKGAQKLVPNAKIFNFTGNIGAIVINDDTRKYIYDYFHLLTLPWTLYIPTDDDVKDLYNIFSKHYDKEYSEFFLKIANFYKENFNKNIDNNKELTLKEAEAINTIENRLNGIENSLQNRLNSIDYNINRVENNLNISNNKINNIVNAIAWWIPNKKIRDNFRNKILDQTRPDQTRPDQTRPQ